MPLAKRFAQLDAVERGGPAFRDLEWNTERSEASHLKPPCRSRRFSTRARERPGLRSADPPRAGLGKETTNQLLRLKPRRLTIVSCDAATLARDLRALLAGGYGLKRLTLIDLFPQTYHFETWRTNVEGEGIAQWAYVPETLSPRAKRKPRRHAFFQVQSEAQFRIELELPCVHASVPAGISQAVNPAEGAVVKVALRIAEMRRVGEVDRLSPKLNLSESLRAPSLAPYARRQICARPLHLRATNRRWSAQ